MRKLLIIISLLLLPILSLADIDDDCKKFTPAGVPEYDSKPGDQELCKLNYAVIHSCKTKTPIAVFEHLTKASVTGSFKRKDNFRPDGDVTPNCRAQLEDYKGPTYDRGHMAPAADNNASKEIMSESFFLSNMVPQVPNNNRGIWRILELNVRDMVIKTDGDFYVVSGTIYDDGYKTIGPGKVGVPTRLYKIIYDKKKDKVIAYLMPNEALPVKDLPKYLTKVSDVEEATGMKFKFK
tara:strand:- start:256 stop:966 length:711 start_codon:yes stop_codon:yes gene_type:complete